MARYDYGFRGPRETTEPRFERGRARRYASEYEPRMRRRPPRRITAPYNLDYVRDRGDRYPVNYNWFGGDWPGQMVGDEDYRYPYLTRGGTRTNRGAPRPIRYDYRDFGPDYGGRYPDEI